MWVDLGRSYHTQVVDLDSRPVWGYYLIIRFTCSITPCEQTTISYVITSIWKIMPFGDFVESSDSVGGLNNILTSNFNNNCSTTYKVSTLCPDN